MPWTDNDAPRYTSTMSIDRLDFRRRRAEGAMITVFDAMKQYIPDEDWPYARDALLKLFHESGAELVTDADRQAFGLPPRGPDGWTMEEIIELERRHHEIMLAPIPPIVIWSVSDSLDR